MPDMFFVFIFAVIIIALVTGILKSFSQIEKTENATFDTNNDLMDTHQQLLKQHDDGTLISHEQSSMNEFDILHHHLHHDNNHNTGDFHNDAHHSHNNFQDHSHTHSHSDF